MRVASILEAKGSRVETAAPDWEVRLVVHRLTSLGIGALVVTPDGETVLGTISERDVVRGLNRHGPGLLDMAVRDAMATDAPTCSPEDSVAKVMSVMTRTRQRHVPVLDADGRLCGLVSIGDLVKHRLDEMELEAHVLRDAYLTRR